MKINVLKKGDRVISVTKNRHLMLIQLQLFPYCMEHTFVLIS